MARKNRPGNSRRINLESFTTVYYSDPDHPEVLKIVDVDQKTIFINVYGDYDGIVKLAPRRW